jgi:DNA polymerase-3 subunit gamma/tau
MSQAFYRSYRSKSLDEVVGQDHITKTLAKAIKSGRLSHAYLFTGPRGVGKTSVARILAHEINQINYSGEDIHLDIIEIDAASNRRIDEIRDLRDKVHIVPTSAKYKVYIIDEVHMLTREAFNALLKTLEEPPAHCIFILATTEAHKLPETIVSRTQKFTFKAIQPKLIADHLAQIAKKEKISITDEALDLIAEHGDGSFRDAIGLLDQLASHKDKITEDTVRQQLGLAPPEYLGQLYESTVAGDLKSLLSSLKDAREKGIDSTLSAKGLSTLIKDKVSEGAATTADVELLKDLLSVREATSPDEMLEVVLLNAASKNAPAVPRSAEATKPKLEESAKKDSDQPKEAPKTNASAQVQVKQSSAFDATMWEDVLVKVRARAPALYTALRLCLPEVDGDKLTLYFEFPLHQKKANLAAHKDIIATAVADICGQNLAVDCEVNKEKIQGAAKDDTGDFYKNSDPEKSIAAISNIFGAAEVLES